MPAIATPLSLDRVGAADIELFADVSGDNNPLHLDDAYARTTTFGERIAHGMLSGAYISAVIGTKLPGPGAIYLSQSLRFRRPVRIGDTVTATVEITGLVPEKHRVNLRTVCSVRGEPVLEGDALVTVPSRAAMASPKAAE